MGISNWVVIVNPKARSGKVSEDWNQISKLLTDNNIPFETLFTRHRYHAVELTVQSIREGYRKIISVGGDGTLHEIVNGIFMQKFASPGEVTLAVIPAGSGNDWSRMYDMSHDFYHSVLSILKGNTILQDIVKVTYTESNVTNVRYMANIGGVGYDAQVCYYCNKMKDKGIYGKMVYVQAAMRALIGRRYRTSEITVDGQPFFSKRIFSVALGTGRYSGSGMMQVPDAIVNDGLLNITVIPKMLKLKVISHFMRLFSGTIYDVKAVRHTVGKVITVKTGETDRLEIDGELVGCTPVTFEVMPQALRVIVGPGFTTDPRL